MLPLETLSQILLHLTRNDLDAVHLVNHSFASLVEAEVFAKSGPLRTLAYVHVLSDTKVKIMHDDRVMIIRPLGMNGAAWIRHSYIWTASIDASDSVVVRWFIVSAGGIHISRLTLRLPFATKELQDQFFHVVKGRKLLLERVSQFDVHSALTSKLFASCDEISIGDVSMRRHVGASVVAPEVLASFVLEAKRRFTDDTQSDVQVAHTPYSGYDRWVYMGACVRIVGEVSKQLVTTLRQKVEEATKACPTFFIKIYDTQMDRRQLPSLRHLNKVTGQHFVVDSVESDFITVKCITVLQKKSQ